MFFFLVFNSLVGCCTVFFFFFGLHLTTEAMGIGGLRAYFLSQSDKRKCGRKDREMHVSQPMDIGVCYALGYFSGKFEKSVLKFYVKVNLGF